MQENKAGHIDNDPCGPW